MHSSSYFTCKSRSGRLCLSGSRKVQYRTHRSMCSCLMISHWPFHCTTASNCARHQTNCSISWLSVPRDKHFDVVMPDFWRGRHVIFGPPQKKRSPPEQIFRICGVIFRPPLKKKFRMRMCVPTTTACQSFSVKLRRWQWI